MSSNTLETIAIILGIVVAFGLFQYMTLRKMKKMEGNTLDPEEGIPGLPAEGKKLVYFYTPTCTACKAMTPVIDRLTGERNDVFKIDASRNITAARKLGIMATPTTLILDGLTIQTVKVGALREKQILSLLD